MVELGVREMPLARLDPRPFDAEPVAVEPEAFGEREILAIAVIAVACVARTLLEQRRGNILGQPGVAVGVVALALVCRDRGAPEEAPGRGPRSEEHTSELQSLMRSSYAVFCL